MMIFRSEFPRYMYYVLNSTIFNYYLGMFLTATINQLTGKNFGDMETVFCPDAAERQKIVNYLDEQCGEIDKVLAKTRESIEEYKKQTELFDDGVYAAISLDTCVMHRRSYGGPAPECVKEQIDITRKKLEELCNG